MFKKVFTLTFICMMIFLSAAFLFINAWSNSIAYDMTYSAYNQSFTSGLADVNELFKSATDELMSICIDEDVQAALLSGNTDAEAVNRAEGTLLAICRRSASIDVNVFRLSEDGKAEYLCTASTVKNVPYHVLEEHARPENAGAFYWEVTDYNSYAIRVYKGIFDVNSHSKVLGVAVLEISLNAINSIFSNICNANTGTVYLLDQNNKVLFPLWEDRVLEITETIPEETRLSIFSTYSDISLLRNLNTTKWKLAMITSGKPVEEKTTEISMYLLWVVLLLFVLMLGASLFIARDTMTPFTRLANQIKNMDPNAKKLEDSARRPYKDEAKLLFSNFNTIIQQRETLQKEIYDITLLKNEAELRSLQAQINPHFLYNTLDSINWMAMKYNATDIQQLVVAFSNMLRYALNNGEDEIPLHKELAQVEGYIYIQKIRFSDRFHYTIEVDEHLQDYPIKKLLLQPLAENAILHGFSEGTPPFMLMIRVRQMGDVLLFEVANNGKKIDLEEIEKRIHPPKGEKPKSYGLNNVNQRLRLNYGPQSEMRFYIKDDFSYATFQIPYSTPEDEEAN